MNSYQIKITGSGELPTQLDPQLSYQLTGEVNIYEVAKRDNNDGTFTIVYKSKWTSAVDLAENGKVIKGIDKKSNSKKNRGAIFALGQELGVPDDEAFYNVFCTKLRANMPAVWEFLKHL